LKISRVEPPSLDRDVFTIDELRVLLNESGAEGKAKPDNLCNVLLQLTAEPLLESIYDNTSRAHHAAAGCKLETCRKPAGRYRHFNGRWWNCRP
jgi:hypothetical protein